MKTPCLYRSLGNMGAWQQGWTDCRSRQDRSTADRDYSGIEKNMDTNYYLGFRDVTPIMEMAGHSMPQTTKHHAMTVATFGSRTSAPFSGGPRRGHAKSMCRYRI